MQAEATPALSAIRGISSMATRQLLAEMVKDYQARTGQATAIESVGGKWKVTTDKGNVTADKLIMATNAYSDGLWPGMKETIIPVGCFAYATEPLSENLRQTILRGKGANSGLMRVKPELQKHLRFQTVNLIQELPLRDAFDVVFCRNVMIYFDAATQRAVLERIHRVMKPGGMLFVGHAENFSDARNLFVLRGKTVYERI